MVHWIERIPYLRNRLREIPKRELGYGVANATNAIMYVAPIGLLCAGDPLKAELMAVDVTSVNQHGKSRDVAGGYAAALAACFLPGATVEEIVRIGLEHTRDWRHVKEMTAMVDLSRKCKTCAEFIERYHEDIIGPLIPLTDLQHEESGLSVSWNSAEILGPALALLLITGGQDPREMILASARMGRDADTICRCSAGLAGAYDGISAIPQDWQAYVLPRNRWLRPEEKAAKLSALVEANLERGIQASRAVLGV
jgi:ADP-ribosylglycohydrolase